ncbi:ankyrin-2-like isoform X8 [Lytechinus variegatus]|uniref:ankyrin-2-like isoform X8 n=1 Tax=Lytechinus variegatus TaxID=7654 RepID=UPI001BB1C610|nr:ankyrin-2-like isoform X8 [Lytechinus variegatus]
MQSTVYRALRKQKHTNFHLERVRSSLMLTKLATFISAAVIFLCFFVTVLEYFTRELYRSVQRRVNNIKSIVNVQPANTASVADTCEKKLTHTTRSVTSKSVSTAGVAISNKPRNSFDIVNNEEPTAMNKMTSLEISRANSLLHRQPKNPLQKMKNGRPCSFPTTRTELYSIYRNQGERQTEEQRILDEIFSCLLKGIVDGCYDENGLNALHLSSKEGHLNIVTELLKRGADVDAATKKGNTALHIASLAGQEDIVRVLVEFNANVNVQSQNGFTPLYMAAQENHVKVVKFLLANGANQNLATEDGFLPLDVATQQGHDIVVETLLQHSRPQYPNKSEDGFTPLAVALQQGHDKVVAVLLENDRAGKTRLPALHIAARKDDTKAASLLLQNGHNPDVPSKSQFTPLHIAAHYGHVNVATLLLQKGASVDYNARNHIKPLHVAAKWGRVNMVNTLLDRGACIDAKTRDGLTPLHCSARSGHEQCVDQLLERGAPISAKTKNGLAPLHMAAQGDHVDSARLLLYHHAPVDDVTVDYLTPLHVAAHCGHHKVAKLLLDRKANPSARALNGFTPLHIACKKNRVKVIELLLKYGASVQAITESGLTPLHVAAFMGNINIVMYLIKNGGGVDETNVRGETPLHLAARANQIEVIRVLLSNGAKVDARAHENQTPLHIAARLGNAEIVKLLLDNGASPDAQTRDLYTALHIAAREGKEDVARVLLDNGATLSMTTKKDFTPLHVAAKYGRYDVAQLLLSRYASPDATAQNGLTPLHIAAHYDNVKVAMLLLDQGASPHKTAKNGFTPLHIAAKKNQMDVATTLLEYGADSNAMTKQGISPIHLAAQEGHTEMLALLLERGAKPNIMSKNGLTPLHLAAQEDQVEAVAMLLDNGSQIDPQTKAGYTPLHVACHYGNLKTATYLLEHGSAVQAKTKHGLTPLHQGAQQGHVAIINILLQHKAEPNETANNGYTALGIAKRFGYISVVNTLSIVTTETSTVISPTEEKLKVQVPETMQVTFMSDTEDEESTGDDVSMTGDQSLLTPQEIRTMGDDSVVNDHRRSWEEDWMRGEPIMNYYTGHESLSGHYGNDKGRPAYSPTGYSTMDSRNSTLNRDFNAPLGRPDDSLIEGEMITVTTQSTVESAPPLLSSTPNRLSTGPVITLNGKTYNIGDPYVDDNGRLVPGKAFGPNGRPVSVTLDNAPINQMPFFAGFLISFIVDARGGTMRSCRLPGLRVVVPPQRASGPTRVTCRLIKRTKLTTQPPLMENESLASRVLEVGPANTQFLGGLGNKSVTYPPLNDGEALCSRIIEMGPPSEKFLRPVLIEVPHFASLRGNEREIVILRSETGETWKEHSLDASDEEIQKSMEGYDVEDNDQSKGQTDRRMCRILTKDFPQYFAIISRVRQETNTIGPSGGMLNSTVVPQVQAVFPEGTLTKKIKVGLQAQPVGNDVVKKVLGNRVMVSPIVTIEPRRRKFHKPITVTIPVPTAYNQGVINGYGGDFPTLRLLCSITGGTAPAQWEDITGTTPLTFVNDCVSFTTTVSARFWLMDCKEIDQASNFARELYQELKAVPFMAKFVVYAKTHDPIEGRVRVFCVTDDKSDKSLEQQENFKEVARSKFVEVLESRPVYIEMAGNLVPVQKSGDQLNLAFTAFHENRLPFFVRVRDQSAERCGRLSFMREPKVPRGLPPQKAACNLNVTMPSYVKVKKASESETESESSSEDEEYKMEKGEREQYTTQKEQKMFTKKELYSLTSIEEYQDGSKEQDGVPSNLNFASIKLRKKYTFLQDPSMSPKSAHQRAEIRLWDVANQVGDQWQDLGRELGLNERELKAIERENDDRPEQAFVMLHNWAEQEGKDATSEKLEEALRSIGRGDIIDRCLGNYVSLDVSAQPDEDSDMMRDIQMALDQSDRLGNDLGAFSPQGQADITLEFSGGQQTPDILQSTLEEQARQEVTDRLIKELKEEAIEASSSEDVQESAAAAEFYEEIKEEILEKHEEERRELHFEPSFGTLEETKEEDSPSPTGPQKSNVDMASAGPSSSKSVTVTQTRVTVTSKSSNHPVESGSESSAETAVFVGSADKTLEGAAEQIRVQVDSISSEGAVETDELEGVRLESKMSQVRIEVDEAPTPDRMSSDENLYIAHAKDIVQEPEIEASGEQQQESINPYRDMEPDPIGDVVIEEPQIQSQSEQQVEGINPYADMEPEPLTGSEPIEEPSFAAVSTSEVHGINPDLLGDPEPLDGTANIPGPDLTDLRHTSMGAQAWEGDTSPGQQTFQQSPLEEFKMGHPGESTVQQITMEHKIIMSKTETQRSEPGVTGYSVSTSEVTVSESGSPRLLEDEVPLATEQFAQKLALSIINDVRDSARPTDLGEPGKPTEHQEKTRVETTRSETVTTVRTVEQKIITGETTKMEIKEDFPEEPPKESEEYKEKVLDHEMPPKSKELEPVDTFESKVKDVERLQESGAVEQIQAQVVQDIPVKEVEKERVENREIVLEYDVKSEVKESEKPTDTGQPCEELAMEDQEVDAIVMVHDSRVSQDVNIQGEYQAVPLERLVQSPEPVASPDAEQKEIYEHEQQKEVTVVRETTKVEEKTVNVVEIKEERHVTQEPEVSESVAEQPESPMQTKNLQSFDKPSEILAAEKEDDETVKEESKAMAAKELSDEPVIEMDKVEEVKEEVEEAPQSPKRENETVTHYQETVTTVVTTTEIRGLEQQEVDGGIFSRPTALEDKEESGEIPGEQVREYVSNVVDSAIIQEQSRTELVDEEDKKPSVDSDNLKEVSQFEDSQESTTVLEKEPDEVVKEAIEVKEKEQVFDDESQEQQAPILTSEPIQDTPEDVPKEEEQSIRTTFIEQKTEEVVVKETVQVIEKEQVVFEDEPQEDQAPTLASEPIQAPEDVPKEEEQSIRTTFIEQKTEEVVVKETVQVIEKEQVVFEDEPHADQTPTVTSEHIHDTPEGAPEEEQPIGTTFVEQKTEEVVVKETVQVIEKEQVVFEDEPPKEQAPTLASEPIQAPKDVPKGDDQPHIEQKTEEVVVKETVQVIEKEQVVLEDEPPKEQAPTLASEPIQAPKDVPKGDDQPHIEQKTEEVVVKETVQVIEKEQVVLEDEPPKEQAPTLASEPIQAPKDVPKGDDQPHIEQKTEEVVVKETVQVIEKEQVVFEDEPQKEQAPTLASEPIQASPEDVPKGDDQPHIEQKTEEVVIKETVQVIEKEQVVFEDEPQADQTPTVTSEHIRDTSDDIPKEEEQSIRTTFIEQKTEEFVVKETVQVIEKEQVVFEDEPPKEQAPTLASEPIQAPPEDVPKGDDQPHIEQKTEEVVIKETVQVIEKEQVVFEDEPEEEQSPTPTSEPSQYTPEDVPEENDQPITEQKTEDVVVKETVQVIEKEQVIFEDEPQEDQTPTVISEHILDTSEDIPKEEEQSIRTTFIEQKTEEVVVKETVQVIEKEQVVFEDEPQADRTPTDTSEHIHDTPEDVPEEEEQPIGTTFIEQKTEEVVVKETVQVIEKEQVVFEDEPQADRTPTDTSEHIHDTPEDVPEEEEQPIGTTFIEQKTEEVVVKETIQVIEKEQVIFEDEPEADQTPTVTSEHIHDVPEDVPEEEEQPIGTTFTEQKTEEVAVKETVQVIEKEQVVFEDEPQKEQAPTLASEPIQAPKDVPKGDDQPYIEQKTEEVVIKETVQVIEKEQVVFENEPQEEQPATFTSEPFQNTPEDVPKEEEQSIRTTFIEQKTEEVVVKETVQVIEKEQVVFEDEPHADQTPTVTSEHIHDTPEGVPEEEQPIGTTFIEQKTEEVVVKETTQVIEKEEVTFEDETKEEQAQTVTSEHIQDATYNVQEDIPKVPVEEPTVEDSESGQDMTLHKQDEFTTQNLEFLGAPEYDEEDISTSMEVMPSERENVDGDDDFLEDIQEEPEGDEMERTDIAPSETTYIYEERTQQVLISNEQIEPSAVTTESHEEIISEERIGEKSSTTEFSHTVLQEEIHLLPEDATVHLEHDTKPQNEEKRDIIHENIEESGVTAVHSEINFHTKPIMDQTKVDEEKLDKVPDDREIIVQEPLGDEPEVCVEARDPEHFTEATPQDHISEISITEERIGEKVVTSTFKETVLHEEIHNIVEESPAVTDESEPPKEEVRGTVCETVHQTTVTTTHTEIHKLSTLPVTEKYLEEMSGEEQHTPEEEQTQPTNAEREDLSPRDEGMTSEDIEELQEDQQGQIRENGSFSHETTTEETRSILTTREVRFVEDIKVDASEPEDETHLGEEPDMTERDISIDEDQSDDSDMIPEIKLDLQSDEIVQDDDVLAERRARDHGYLIEPDPPTEESEIILGEDEIFEEQLGVDDEDLDTKTDSISYMEEQVDETTLGKEDQQLTESVPVDYDIQPSDISHVEDKSERRPEYKKEEADITTSYKTIEESMIIQGEVYLESEPKEEQKPDGGEMAPVEQELDRVPEDGRSTPDILDITGEYATSYAHVEMSQQSYQVDEPMAPLDVTQEAGEEETPRYTEEMDVSTGDSKEGAALVAVEQQYLVDTPVSETSTHEQWVETQVGDATVRTRETHREETYTDETEDGQTLYTRHVVTETRVITSGGPLLEGMMHPAEYPEELIIQPQPPSPDSLLTPEIQELPDTPESSTHEGSTEPTDNQGFCFETMDVTQSTSESSQFVVDDDVLDHQVQQQQEEQQEAPLLDGPTESDYYDPSLIGVPQQQEFDYQLAEPEPEIIDSPQDVELPEGEDISSQQYSDFTLQQEVSASLSHQDQSLGDVPHSETVVQESHVEFSVHSEEQSVPDNETFDVAEEDRADSIVSPRPPEPVSEVEAQLPPIDVSVLESSPAPEPETENIDEGAVGDEVDSPTKPYKGQIPIPTSPKSEGSEEPPRSPQGSVDDQSDHVVTHEEYETKQEDGGVVKKSVHVTRTTFRREVSFPGAAVQSGQAILQTRSVSEFHAGPDQTHLRSREPLVDEQLDAPMVLGEKEEKPAFTPEELEDFAQALNDFAINDLPEDDQESPATPSDQAIVQEDMSATESAPPVMETNLKTLDEMTPEEEKEMEDLLNMDFTKAYQQPTEEGQAPRSSEPEEVSPSTPASPTTPHVDLMPDDTDLLAAANQLQKEMEEEEPEVGGASMAEAGDEEREPKTPEITDFLEGQFSFLPDEPLGVVETEPNIEFPPEMEMPVDGDEDVEEEIEEYEETLDDGTIRKVIKRRIKKRTVQMIPVEIDPSEYPEGAFGDDDDVRRITVHKKVTRKTFMRDGEEVDQQEEVETNIEEDGVVKENSELREDLQQIVDGLLKDQSIEGESTTTVVVSEETHEGEESEI